MSALDVLCDCVYYIQDVSLVLALALKVKSVALRLKSLVLALMRYGSPDTECEFNEVQFHCVANVDELSL